MKIYRKETIYKIKDCDYCPNLRTEVMMIGKIGKKRCTATDKLVLDADLFIPNWCPLPDAEDDQ